MATKEGAGLRNQLKIVRTRLGLSQAELASAAGVARQTIGGIEAELYAPSAAVALRLARALGCTVEELFWLDDEAITVQARPVSGMPNSGSTRVSLARVGGQWVASPLHGNSAFRTEMVPADGIGTLAEDAETMQITLLDDPESLTRTVSLAGCTPALSLWARSAERWFPGLRVQWKHANSTEALFALARSEVHAAGVHVCDTAGGGDNASHVRATLPNRDIALVNLGTWIEGLAVGYGNPKGILNVNDLARKDVTFINREHGAGARILLDSVLHEAGLNGATVNGYETSVNTHHDIAQRVATGKADAGVTNAAMAAAFGLDFVPLRTVKYDLALPVEHLQHEPVQQLLSTLQHRWVRSQLNALCGYDTSMTGEVTFVSK